MIFLTKCSVRVSTVRRRTTATGLFFMLLILSLYPLVAHLLPR
jgi:hypothetical protein